MRGLLSAALACAAAFSVAEAHAEIWAFSYSGAYQGVVYSASGAFTTGNVGSPYTITGVSGTADGYPITGLSPWAAANQLLYYDGSGVYADYNGITFAASGADYNLSNYPSGNSLLVSTLDPNITVCCQIGLSMTVTDVGSQEKFWNFSYSGVYQGVVYSASACSSPATSGRLTLNRYNN